MEQTPIPSLVHLCLEFISVSFGRISWHHSHLTEDAKSIVFSYLSQRGALSNEAIEYFLPNSQTILNLADNPNIENPALITIAKITGSSLTSISLVDCFSLTDQGLISLSKETPQLQRLDLGGCFLLSWIGMYHLAQNNNKLNELDLTECSNIGDKAIAAILRSSTLTILTIAECYRVQFTFQNLSTVDPMDEIPFVFDVHKDVKAPLKSLCLRRTPVTDNSIKIITEIFDDIRILDLSWCTKLTGEFAVYIANKKFEKIFALNLWGVKVDDRVVNILCRACTGLTSLTLCDNMEITEQSVISMIAMLSSLHTLNLWGCTNLSNPSIQLLLRHGTKLQSLGLSFCTQINDLALVTFSNLTRVKSLQFESCPLISDKTLNTLGNTTISSINFRKCTSLGSSALENCILRCPNITSLNVSFVQISKDGLFNCLAICKQIKVLDISGNKTMDDSLIENLIKNDLHESLLTLKLDECPNITDRAIQDVLKVFTKLQTLSLCFCSKLSDPSFETMSKNNFSLTSISLGGCGLFTDNAIKKISLYCPKMKDLVIPWNKLLTDLTMEYLGNGCKSLKTLNLAYCPLLTDEGLKHLGSCRALKRLDLGHCPSFSATALLSFVGRMKHLQVLRIKKNSSEEISSYLEEQITKLLGNITLETTAP